MSVFKIRERLAVSGSLTLGGDVVLSRGAANRLNLASGDSFVITAGTLNASAGTIVVPNGTAAAGTALTANGVLSLATVGGTPAIRVELNGTAYRALLTAI